MRRIEVLEQIWSRFEHAIETVRLPNVNRWIKTGGLVYHASKHNCDAWNSNHFALSQDYIYYT